MLRVVLAFSLMSVAPAPLADPSPTPSFAQERNERALDQSRDTWNRLKQVHGNSYTYIASGTRESGSITEETEVTVEDDTVVSRRYRAHGEVGPFKWDEPHDLIGSHADGAPPVTVEELYDTCAREILALDSMTYWVTLSFDQQGLLRQCTHFARNATDPEGISLIWVRFAP